MAAAGDEKLYLLVACSLLLLAVGCQASPLQIGFYHDRCPQAEAIVKGVMMDAISQNPGNGAAMIRMLFHDCFVEGCDASVLLDPTPFSPTPEKLSAPNNPSLRGFELIDAIKDALEAACPGVVSCADIIAFSARDASCILSAGKVDFEVPSGRRDGTFSNASEPVKFLVPPTSNLSDLVDSFVVKGLDAEDLVILSGAHTIGRSHCSAFVPDRPVPRRRHPGRQRPHGDAGRSDPKRSGQAVLQERVVPHGALHLRRSAPDIGGDGEDGGGQRQHPRMVGGQV
ncbi:unnamed protein product [Triticum turgidum subsp. durum]|uniref:Peroxidase n=1 Tax=Triticum turgidum subsp. durum TaxID=4567 RepID=A0A9R0W481_TRITD|nr:unnamed protein product [Triticum turgidum subsp. durum]